MRYRLINGVPAWQPDLTYARVSSTFAVGTDGSVYDIKWIDNSDGMEVLAPDKDVVRRRIVLADPYSTWYQGLLARDGYAYAQYLWDPSAASRSGRGARYPGNGLCDEDTFIPSVLVYGPGARGQAPWRQCFPTSTEYYVYAQIVWMALDGRGDLYVPSTYSTINVITAPRTDPKLSRSLENDDFKNIHAIADDGHGNIYVAETRPGATTEFIYSIATFADSGSGAVAPIRELYYRSAGMQQNIAVDDRYLYVGTCGGVLIYSKSATGYAAPFATLPLPFVGTQTPVIAIGP